MQETIALVIPCYNEAARLDRAEFLRMTRKRPGLSLLFVDDGSTDATGEVLSELQRANHAQIHVQRLPRNSGKAEAVRQGLLAALARRWPAVGYTDADLSTPVDELLRMMEDLEQNPVEILLGARVRLLGRRIERKLHRHYLGRLFATIASAALRLPVYDTQCGAKLFRASPALAAALVEPFRSRWIFDVELLARLRRGCAGAAPVDAGSIRELPLGAWRDVGGSKLKPWSMLGAGLQLIGMLITERLRGIPERRHPVAAPKPAILMRVEPSVGLDGLTEGGNSDVDMSESKRASTQ